MATSNKNIDPTRGNSATGLTLDQYINRYATLQKILSFSQWKLQQYDNNGDGAITRKDFSDKGWREYSKLTTDDFNKAYAEYLDTVTKSNAYAKNEAAAIWKAANGISDEEKELTTMATEREELRERATGFDFGMQAGNLLLYAGIGIVVLLLLFKKK